MSVGKCFTGQNTAKCQYILMYLLNKYLYIILLYIGTLFTQMICPFDYCTWLVRENVGNRLALDRG